MPVLRNIGQLATCRAAGGQADIHPIPNAALVWNGPIIQWVGPEAQLPSQYQNLTSLDARQRLVDQGFDVIGGSADEFAQTIRRDTDTFGRALGQAGITAS